MGMGLLTLTDDLKYRRVCDVFDDFESYTDAQLWTKGTSGTGTTVTSSDGANGLLSLGNAGSTTNAEAWVATTRKNWLVKANACLLFEARINAQEANTNNLGLFVGFSSAFATGLLVNTTLTPATSMSAAGFYLKQGSTNWSVISSVGSTQTLTDTNEAAAAAGDQILRVQVEVVGTNMEVSFFVGNAESIGGSTLGTSGTASGAYPTGFQLARETASGFLKPIKHRVAYSGIVKMGGGVFLKQASTTAETCLVDYISLLNLRA